MSTENKEGLLLCQGLTQKELADIERLADICNKHDGSDMKLNWENLRSRPRNETNDFLYYADGTLVGYLALFSFDPKEAETSGMVHPGYRRKGIFTTLLKAAAEECRRRGLPRILLIVGHTYRAGVAFAKARGARYDHSEYKMELRYPKLPARFDQHLRFRQACPEEGSVLAHIMAVSFDMPENEVNVYTADELQNPARRYYIALLDNVYIGKIDVALEENEAVIYGFGVLPAYRGRSYGRQILAKTIQEILALGRRRIILEVATENKSALSLYQSCGFKETASYDYYSFDIEKT